MLAVALMPPATLAVASGDDYASLEKNSRIEPPGMRATVPETKEPFDSPFQVEHVDPERCKSGEATNMVWLDSLLCGFPCP